VALAMPIKALVRCAPGTIWPAGNASRKPTTCFTLVDADHRCQSRAS